MENDLFSLDNKICIVSGAASGMGKQISLGFAEYGASVILVDINIEGAEETHSLIKNNIARQIFSDNSIFAMLPISNTKTSIVWSIKKNKAQKSQISKGRCF